MSALLCFVLLNVFITFLGYGFVKWKAVVPGWILCVTSVALVNWIFLAEMPTIRMFVIITTLFTGMKVVVTTITYRERLTAPIFQEWIAFVFTWAGMRAEIFEMKGSKPLPGAKGMIVFGVVHIAGGSSLIFLSHQLAWFTIEPVLQYTLTTALLLIAFSLILHFGLLNISAGVWRHFGVDAYYLFKKPLQAKTLGDFWSKRWNIAFSEMTSIAVFRPLRQKVSGSFPLMAAFIFSGVLHELAISVPVNGGYGLPTLYFLIQGLAVSLEKVLIQKKIILFQNVVMSKIWLVFWLIVPIPLLFHERFVKDIIWPLAGLYLQ